MHFYVSCATARKQKKKLLKHQRVLTYSYCPKQYMDSFFTERCNYLSVKKSKKKVMLLDVTQTADLSGPGCVTALEKLCLPHKQPAGTRICTLHTVFWKKKKEKKIFLKCSSETKKKRWMFKCRQTPAEIRDGWNQRPAHFIVFRGHILREVSASLIRSTRYLYKSQ